MAKNRTSLDLSVFTFHNKDRSIVEPVKVDPLPQFLPLALAVAGFALIFFAKASMAAPFSFQGAPLEFNLKNLTDNRVLQKQWAAELPLTQLPGSVEGGRWEARLGSMRFFPRAGS
ncbi:MAG: hypothetical protein JST16_08355 [Bdellovibrionales bacterium]|nr:hypothetical protein [Bdellovibrionales bacterium]